MPPDTHALLSASSADRWLHCPPSAKLAVAAPPTTSDYAEAGRLAHAIAEIKAAAYFHDSDGDWQALKQSPHYDPAMDSATDEYLDALKEQALSFEVAPIVMLETKVDFSDVAPGGFGTADCIMIGHRTLVIADYKNGAGVPVEAENNAQLKLYAWGALRLFSPLFAIETVRLVIVQPHAGGTKVWETSVSELESWAEQTVRPAAVLAAKGEGEFCAGEWCDSHFCPVRATCRHRAAYLLGIGEKHPTLPPELTDAEVGEVLTRAKELKKWVEALEEYAHVMLMAGHDIPGFKIVAGRTSRSWTGGADAAFEELKMRGVPEALLYKREPITPPALEKALTKKAFAEKAAGLVTVSPGKPTLALLSDKRPAYNPAAAAFNVVTDDE